MANRFREMPPKPVSRKAADLLLHKRRAFSFEREVRVLWLDKQHEKNELWIPLRAGHITQVMISPYVDQQTASEIKRYISEKQIPVLQSQILAHPR